MLANNTYIQLYNCIFRIFHHVCAVTQSDVLFGPDEQPLVWSRKECSNQLAQTSGDPESRTGRTSTPEMP